MLRPLPTTTATPDPRAIINRRSRSNRLTEAGCTIERGDDQRITAILDADGELVGRDVRNRRSRSNAIAWLRAAAQTTKADG